MDFAKRFHVRANDASKAQAHGRQSSAAFAIQVAKTKGWTSHGAVDSSDVQRLPMALDAVTADTKQALGQVLADAG